MKICMLELTPDPRDGSIGVHFIKEHAKMAGFQVDTAINSIPDGYDIELLSMHHSSDYPRLINIKKKSKIRIVGGHPMQSNPRPVIPFSDVICLGEGESWIKNVLNRLNKNLDIDELSGMTGTIICRDWKTGSALPNINQEYPLPHNPPYLSREGTKSATWFIEIARGCAFSCSYCELGNLMHYRHYSKEHIKDMIDMVDPNRSRKVNLYAPDVGTHKDYNEICDYIRKKGLYTAFSSTRIDTIMRNGLPDVNQNHLIRAGIDGMTEETRFRVGKKLTDDMIVDFFKKFIERGHVSFKIFMIFGYEWERLSDFDEFTHLIDRIKKEVNLTKNVSLRIKWTPLTPIIGTPLGLSNPVYDHKLVRRILEWHGRVRYPEIEPSLWITCDGVPHKKTWKQKAELSTGNEFELLRRNQKNVIYHRFIDEYKG